MLANYRLKGVVHYLAGIIKKYSSLGLTIESGYFRTPRGGRRAVLLHGTRGHTLRFFSPHAWLRRQWCIEEIACTGVMVARAASGGKGCFWWQGLFLVARAVTGGKSCFCC